MTVWELETRAKENKQKAIAEAQKKLKEKINLSIKDAEDRLKEFPVKGATLADVIVADLIESLEYGDSFEDCMWIPELKKLYKVMGTDTKEFAY